MAAAWAGLAVAASCVLLVVLWRGPRGRLSHAAAFLAGAAVSAAVGPGAVVAGPGALLRAAPLLGLGRIAAGGLAGLLALRLQATLAPGNAARGGWFAPDGTRYVLLWLAVLSAGLAAQWFPRARGAPFAPLLLLAASLGALALGEVRGRKPYGPADGAEGRVP